MMVDTEGERRLRGVELEMNCDRWSMLDVDVLHSYSLQGRLWRGVCVT